MYIIIDSVLIFNNINICYNSFDCTSLLFPLPTESQCLIDGVLYTEGQNIPNDDPCTTW